MKMKIVGAQLELKFKIQYIPPTGTKLNLEFNTQYNADSRSVSIGITTIFGSTKIANRSLFVRPSGFNGNIVGLSGVDRTTPKLIPLGIESKAVVGTPQYVRWRRFLAPSAISEPEITTVVTRIRALGGYNAPSGLNLNLNWRKEHYVSPFGSGLNLEFGQIGYNGLIIGIGDQSVFGKPDVSQQLAIAAKGYDYSVFGTHTLSNERSNLRPYSIDASVFGKPSIDNGARNYKINGFYSTLFGGTRVELWRRFINVSAIDIPRDVDSHLVMGGMRFLYAKAFDSLVFGAVLATNTRATRTIAVAGIRAEELGKPNVHPQIIFVAPFISTKWGNPLVQSNPHPQGFVNTRYGTAWVTQGQRFLNAQGFNGFSESYPKVFDPKQFIIQQLTKIPNGIFGDISLRNKNLRIATIGQDFLEFPVWASIESNLRKIHGRSDNVFMQIGTNEIHNKTPSLAPKGWSGSIGSHHIDFAIRKVYVTGFYQYQFGKAVLTKTPSFTPVGFTNLSFGTAFISNYERTLEVKGLNQAAINSPIVWHRVRFVSAVGGINNPSVGASKIEHGIRYLLINGFDTVSYGRQNLTFRVRQILTTSITEIFRSNHTVGGTRYILPDAFVASKFGSRIIPISQQVYANGFSTLFGDTTVNNKKTYLKPSGFTRENDATHGRFGVPKTYNMRQYVTMYPDVDSLLNPPRDNSKWLKIENRNKNLMFYGSSHSIVARPSVANKARAILTTPIESLSVGVQRVSYYRRHIRVEAIEHPPISTWSTLWNIAKVLKPKGFDASLIGVSSFENTRRYRKVQGFYNTIFGYPFIADRIRHLTFETRYSIAPPRIELPNVQLLKRYIEPNGIFKLSIGGVELRRYQGKFTPRWTHRDYVSEPIVRNVTPEIRVRSLVVDEFGRADLKLWKRYVSLDGFIATNIGKSIVDFSTRRVTVRAITSIAIPTHKIERFGSQPYTTQHIILRNTLSESSADDKQNYGYGIPIPGGFDILGGPYGDAQVSKARVNENNIVVPSILEQLAFGRPSLNANSIRFEPGYSSFEMGEHHVSLKNRKISVAAFPMLDVFEPSKAYVSPNTIWAVFEAPPQAVKNHDKGGDLHYINSHIVFGQAVVQNRHRTVKAHPIDFGLFGSPSINLRHRTIKPNGFTTFRFGYHAVPEYIRTLTQYDSQQSLVFGNTNISHKVDNGPRAIKPAGLNAFSMQNPLVQFFNREFKITGFVSTKMGESVHNDTDYYPQRLHVGFKKGVTNEGVNTSIFGQSAITYRVRQVDTKGFDSFISTYSISHFKDRLKVALKKKPVVVLNQVIIVNGIQLHDQSIPDIKLNVHYIRPDGNSEQFRKGGGIE